MKIGIVGTRGRKDGSDKQAIWKAVDQQVRDLPPGTIVVTGDCTTGVDYFVREIATELGFQLVVFHAAGRWAKMGKRAGPERNRNLAEYVERLVAIPGPESKGAWNCAKFAGDFGKPVVIVRDLLPSTEKECERCHGFGTTPEDEITPWKNNPCSRCDGSGKEPTK